MDRTDQDRPWRQGRKLGRTVYLVVGEEPSDDDIFIGIMESCELAGEVVALHNDRFRGPHFGDLLAKIHA